MKTRRTTTPLTFRSLIPLNVHRLTHAIFLVAAVAFAGCGPSLLQRGVAQRFGGCNPEPCFTVHIETVPHTALEGIMPDARRKIERALVSSLYSAVDGDLSIEPGKELESLVDPLLARFNEESSRPDGRRLDWILRRRVDVVFSNDEVITLDVVSDEYLGGAHSINEHTLRTFLKRDGSVVSLDTLVAPYSRSIFESVLAMEFRRSQQIPPGSSFESVGFSIKEGAPLPIPENMGVTEDGLLLHYNPYEIAPYSKGAFSFKVPLDPLEPLLRGGDAAGGVRSFFKTKP